MVVFKVVLNCGLFQRLFLNFVLQVCATLGTTGACAFDNIKELGLICKFRFNYVIFWSSLFYLTIRKKQQYLNATRQSIFIWFHDNFSCTLHCFYYFMLNVKKVVLERNTSSLLLADFKSLDFTLLRKVELLQ